MAAPTPNMEFDIEEFWEDLLAFVENRDVIPVVGSELLTIEEQGRTVPLYRAVAERLLLKYRLPADNLPERDELRAAVSVVAAAGKRVKDLYRPVHDILKSVLTAHPEPPPVLRELAAIRDFNLFVTTTPDDLLARAIDAERFAGMPQTDQLAYAPNLATEEIRDFPKAPSSQYAGVFYLFGKAATSPWFAIHEEDALEFPYWLQASRKPEGILTELRRRHLLLIGCDFPDWLNRFFLRLSNVGRLSGEGRTKREFLVGEAIEQERGFCTFLQRFSQDSRYYPMPAREFVRVLHQRWCERNPAAAAPAMAPEPAAGAVEAKVFISYASEDIGAARCFYSELQKIAGDVMWFDKQELRPGDDWNEKILSAVKRCSIFVPLISGNTERRDEGYFRREWNLAADRCEAIHGRRFVFPVVIDTDAAASNSYALVPERFKTIQFGRAPGGRMSQELCDELRTELRNLARRQRP